MTSIPRSPLTEQWDPILLAKERCVTKNSFFIKALGQANSKITSLRIDILKLRDEADKAFVKAFIDWAADTRIPITTACAEPHWLWPGMTRLNHVSLTLGNTANYRQATIDLALVPVNLEGLEELFLGNGALLTVENLCRLKSCTKLRKLGMICVNMTNLEELPLKDLKSLKNLDLTFCVDLVNITSLQDCPNLDELNLSATAIASLVSVTCCTALRTLSLNYCQNLHDLSPVSRLTLLRVLNARNIPIQTLPGLSHCEHLNTVDVSGCTKLTSLEGLGESKSITEVLAHDCGLEGNGGLRNWATLKKIDVSGCGKLCTLNNLAGAPALEVVLASKGSFTDVACLRGCDALRELDVSDCTQLRTLKSLSGAKSLEVIRARRTALTDLPGLELCKNLKTIDVTYCDPLENASAVMDKPFRLPDENFSDTESGEESTSSSHSPLVDPSDPDFFSSDAAQDAFARRFNAVPTGTYHVANGCTNGRRLYEGSLGGIFYLTPAGNRSYVK